MHAKLEEFPFKMSDELNVHVYFLTHYKKKSDQNVVTICKSLYGNKQAYKVLKNSHLKYGRSCAYKRLERTSRKTDNMKTMPPPSKREWGISTLYRLNTMMHGKEGVKKTI